MLKQKTYEDSCAGYNIMEDKKLKLDRTKLTPEQRDKLDAYEDTQKQLQSLSDIADMVQELVNVTDDGNKNLAKLEALGAILTDSREQLVALNKKEAPEAPDHSKPVVEAVNKLSREMSKLKLDPSINVASPDVNVPEVDLTQFNKILKTDIPKAFEKAIKSIPKVEIPKTDNKDLLKAWEGISEQLVSIENATRMKPAPGLMKVTNPDGSLIGDQLLSKDRFAVGQITTQNVSTLWGGTGGSSVVLAVEGPYSVLAIQTVGTYTGALTVQGSVDGLNWVSYAGSQILNMNTGLYLATITSALQSTFQVDISGMKYVRVTALAAVTGSVRVAMAASEADSPRGALSVLTTLTSITNWGNIVDNAAFTDGTTRLSPNGYIYDEVAGTALTENDAAAARIDVKRAQIFTLEDATTRGQRLAINALGAISVTNAPFSSSTGSNVAGSATSVTLKASNASRKELKIQNDSTAILYLKEGATASATDFTYKLYQDDIYLTNNYTGIVDGIWASATGTARVTES